jgi:hypothetical protein
MNGKKYMLGLGLAVVMLLGSPFAQANGHKAKPVDGKAAAEKFILPHHGVAAIVFDEKGHGVVIDKDGVTLPNCQMCTETLEKKYGPKCEKAPKVSEIIKDPATASKHSDPPVCDKTLSTTVRSATSINIVEHSGSQCRTIFIPEPPHVVQYCW